MTALPISNTQFDRLGKRLADGTASASDEDLFEEIRIRYAQVLDAVQARLKGLNVAATGRVKTTGTLIDKLQRTPGLTIRGIHDLAGSRIVVPPQKLPKGLIVDNATCLREVEVPAGRYAQDLIVMAIKEAFAPPLASKPPKVIDRRAQPSYGYRAVHIVVFLDGLPVEIQVRTELQHLWAEITERLGDAWGRGLRYGGGPTDPDVEVVIGGNFTRGSLVEGLAGISEQVEGFEKIQDDLVKTELRLSFIAHSDAQNLWQDVEKVRRDVERGRVNLRELLDRVMRFVEGLERS